MNTQEIMSSTGEVKFLLYKNREDEAIAVLSNIIHRLFTSNQYQRDEKMKDVLILSLLERLDINFKKNKYQDVVLDVAAIKQLGYDIYSDKNIFLIYHQAKTEVHNEKMLNDFKMFKLPSDEDIETTQENITIHHNAKIMFGRKRKILKRLKN
ncbi:unnamed protein product [Rotaria magnacalcarata]|uniref:Uncharacterized protein n=2 Tax=Rotaria magnacalcarata TaxID=392030 RepID=A0A816E9B5_9BILA|nr:unnamed protein product [Rotaria magnacalcarata]